MLYIHRLCVRLTEPFVVADSKHCVSRSKNCHKRQYFRSALCKARLRAPERGVQILTASGSTKSCGIVRVVCVLLSPTQFRRKELDCVYKLMPLFC